MYSMVLADVLKRWQLLLGRPAILSTGTDEHGLKVGFSTYVVYKNEIVTCVYRSSRLRRLQIVIPNYSVIRVQQCSKYCVQCYTRNNMLILQDLARVIDISNDHFVRTTDAQHKDAVQYAWVRVQHVLRSSVDIMQQVLQDRGYIYSSKHEGWYSVSDETFFPESAVKVSLDPSTGRKLVVSVETGKEVQWTSERNYHFRLSAFRERLLAWYEGNPNCIVPASRMKDVVAAVQSGLEDLSISRPLERLTWGIKVPTDDTQTVYVWLDALLNYATKLGYPWTPGTEQTSGWPADVHVVGKDIVRFHCIYWPAFLMALDLPLPKQILTHAHWLLASRKMSKSSGNGVNPFFAIDRFGVDPLRYFLIHSGGIEQDAEYDNGLVVTRYNKDLKNGLGNLASRVMYSRGWSVQRAVKRYTTAGLLETDCTALDVPQSDTSDAAHGDLSLSGFKTQLAGLTNRVQSEMVALMPNKAVQAIAAQIYAANAFFQRHEPWNTSRLHHYRVREKRVMTEQEREDMENRLSCIVYLASETLRIAGILLLPTIPARAAVLLDTLGVDQDRRSIEYSSVGADSQYGVSRAQLNKAGKNQQLFPMLACDI